jgi:hypothetical protein
MDSINFLDQDNSRKILSIISLAAGMTIFCWVILFRVDVWAHKRQIDVQMAADQEDFEMSRYRRTVIEIMNKK